jgi:hypothetical protein
VRLSIIVPVFEVEAFLGRCLESLLDQDLSPDDYEIVVINDGSEDGSLALANRYAHNHQNVHVHTQPNQGLSAARNAGVIRAKGRYVFFVDSDDYVARCVLASLVDLMDQENLHVLGFGHVSVDVNEPVPDSGDERSVLDRVEVVSGLDYVANHRYANNAWWYLLDRQFLLDSGIQFEQGRYVEDAIFTASVLCAADRVAKVPIAVYYYVQRPGSIMRLAGDTHARKMIADYERVVFGLGELRQRIATGRNVPEGTLTRLQTRQQSFVFFLIGRLMRSSLPEQTILPDVLDRFRTIHAYPLSHFPGADYPGIRYRLLGFIFSRPFLLFPFIKCYRIAATFGRLR